MTIKIPILFVYSYRIICVWRFKSPEVFHGWVAGASRWVGLASAPTPGGTFSVLRLCSFRFSAALPVKQMEIPIQCLQMTILFCQINIMMHHWYLCCLMRVPSSIFQVVICNCRKIKSFALFTVAISKWLTWLRLKRYILVSNSRPWGQNLTRHIILCVNFRWCLLKSFPKFQINNHELLQWFSYAITVTWKVILDFWFLN